MLWIIFALIAPALWALSNLVDKHLIDYHSTQPITLVALTGLFAIFPMLGAIAWGGAIFPGLTGLLLALIGGVLATLTYYPYFRALQFSDPATVVLMWNLTPVCVAVLAAVFISERLSLPQYAAIALLVSGSLIAAPMGNATRWHHNPALRWMIVASIISASTMTIQKALFELVPFSVGLFWMSVPAVVLSGTIAIWHMPTRAAFSQPLFRRIGLFLVANQAIDMLADTSARFAVSLGPVSLVNAIGGLQPMFILAFAFLIHLKSPGRWSSGPSSSHLVKTLCSAALAMIGLALIVSNH